MKPKPKLMPDSKSFLDKAPQLIMASSMLKCKLTIDKKKKLTVNHVPTHICSI